MKKYIIVILGLFLFLDSNAQEIKDSIPKSNELKQTQYDAWNTIKQEWFTKEYGKILKENKLKMNCNGCSSIFMTAIITIDSVGKLKEYKVLQTKKCGNGFSKKLEERFMKWFLQLKFPVELYQTKFEIILGKGLKC